MARAVRLASLLTAASLVEALHPLELHSVAELNLRNSLLPSREDASLDAGAQAQQQPDNVSAAVAWVNQTHAALSASNRGTSQLRSVSGKVDESHECARE